MDKFELKNIISDGAIIRTKFEKSEWISNVVYKALDGCLQVELTQDYVKKLVMVGDAVKCKYSTKNIEYIFDGIVSNIEIEGPRILTINVININRFDNERKYNRYDAYIISRITLNRESPVFSVVTSLSTLGMSVVSKTELQESTDAFIEVFVDSGNTLRFFGNIVRKSATENGYEYGIKFKQLEQQDVNMLGQIMEQYKEKDDSLLKRFLDQKKA